MNQTDAVLDALDVVLDAVTESRLRLALIEERATELRRLRASGHRYAEIVEREERPLLVELLSDTIALLHDASGPFRREEARALHSEGVTMERIASLFGVTRQRVSELLRTRARPRVRSK